MNNKKIEKEGELEMMTASEIYDLGNLIPELRDKIEEGLITYKRLLQNCNNPATKKRLLEICRAGEKAKECLKQVDTEEN